MAIEQSSEDVYVYDGGGEAVYKFDAVGNPVDFSSTGTNEISGVPGAYSGEGEIAVDGSPGPAKGDIYVAHAGSDVRVYDEAGDQVGQITEEAGQPWGEACGVAVGGDGAVYVGLYPNEVNKYVPTSGVVSDADYVGSYEGVESVCNVGVDPAGDLFVDTWSSGPVTSFAPSQLGVPSATGTTIDQSGSTVAIDPANEHVFVDEGSQVSEFGPNGKPEESPLLVFGSFGPGALSGSLGIAVDEESNDVYAASGEGAVNVFGAPVIVPGAKTTVASSVEAESAVANGEVNPEELPVEECYFEFGESTSYGQIAQCAESEGEIGAGGGYVPVHADLPALTPGVEYHYRLVAANENGLAGGEDVSFAYLIQKIEGAYAENVTATSAVLGASLNPNGTPTEYFFEYGTNPSYGSNTATREVSGESVQSVQAPIEGLLPETTYHYRLLTNSARGPADGQDLTFVTQGLGGPLTLLDGRQWELVSPPEKYGAAIKPQVNGGSVVQASESGDAISYVASNPVEAKPEGNSAPEPSQIMARRALGGGWANRTLNPANEDIHQLPVGTGLEYRAFSGDLSRAILQPYGTTPLSPSATKERAPYLREEAACDEGSSGCFTPFLTRADTMPGAEWDPNPPYAVPGLELKVHFDEATPDLSHSVLSSGVKLLEDGGEPSMYGGGYEKEGLYEWSSDGRLRFVSVNATGEPAPGELAGVRNGISSDGSRIIWCEGSCGRKPLLMRDTATEETLTIASGAGEDFEARFQAATEDGSKIFYTVEPIYPEKQLWVCEVIESSGKLECAATEIASTTVGLTIGINDAGTTVYFVSTAALAGAAEAGANNLYVANLEAGKWEPQFIATLSSEDAHDWDPLSQMIASVAPNGRYLAFMSDRSLTGYDNHDAVSGEPDQEVFLYDEQTGKLACASCDPTGARPDGSYLSFDDGTLVNKQNVWREDWVAANLPGWDLLGLQETPRQFRFLSDEGRVFFNSSDGLVPQDSNGQQDIYEYEPSGTGSCTRAEGCVNLISAGKSGQESVFLESSASGNDVFFVTTEQLTPQDTDTAFDVYDAHVCTAAVPCEQARVSAPPCSSDESCKPAQTPQPSIFGASPSATFSGAGNPPRTSKAQTGAGKKTSGKKRKGGKRRLQRALEKCKRKEPHKRAKERRCEATARKRYGGAATHRAGKSRETRPARSRVGQNGRGR